MKKIDDGSERVWRRPMMETTIEQRFGLDSAYLNISPVLVPASLAASCPQCGHPEMLVAHHVCSDGRKVYWPQCAKHSSDQAHGYGKFSPHSWRPPYGRPPGSKNKTKPGQPEQKVEKKTVVPEEIDSSSESADYKAEPETETDMDQAQKQKAVEKIAEDLKKLISGGETDPAIKQTLESLQNQIVSIRTDIESVRVKAENLPREVEIKIKKPEKDPVKLEGVYHEVLEKMLKLIVSGTRAFLLSGPTGSGKSTLAYNIADALYEGRCCALSGNDQVVEEKIIGYMSGIKDAFVETALLKAMVSDKPGVILIDEGDALRPNVQCTFNEPMANGRVHTPAGTLKVHEDTVFVFTANTTGSGANRAFSGRYPIEGSLLDRLYELDVGYSERVERAAVQIDNEGYRQVKEIRKKLIETGSRRQIGTRWLRKIAQTKEAFGHKTTAAAIREIISHPAWDDSERKIVQSFIGA